MRRWLILTFMCTYVFAGEFARAADTSPAAGAPATGASPAIDDRQQALEVLTLELVRDVATLRGLELQHPVAVRVASANELESKLRTELDDQLDDVEALALVRALSAFGFMPADVDLKSTLIDLLSAQVVGVYDPPSATYLLVEGVDPVLTETIAVHELTHAVTDQHFDLEALLLAPVRDGRLSEDGALAIQFVVEGDATYVMMSREVRHMMGDSIQLSDEMLAASIKIGLSTFGRMSLDEQMQLMGQVPLGDDAIEQMQALEGLPAILVRPLLATYLEGAGLVAEVKAQGGWAAVNALYENPPASTEQVMHVDKLLPERDEPTTVHVPEAVDRLVPGERSVDEVLGELYIRTLFEANDMWDEAAELAAGWDGDRLVLYEDKDEWAAVWRLVWDSADDALQFAGGFGGVLDRLGLPSQDDPAAWRLGQRAARMQVEGVHVIVVNASDPLTARRLTAAGSGGVGD